MWWLASFRGGLVVWLFAASEGGLCRRSGVFHGRLGLSCVGGGMEDAVLGVRTVAGKEGRLSW